MGEEPRGRDIEGNVPGENAAGEFLQPDRQNSHAPSSPSTDIPLSAVDRTSLGMSPTRWQTEETGNRDYPH